MADSSPRYYNGYHWAPVPGGYSAFGSGPHSTMEEANQALRKMLKASGYEPPKWWQYWRWGERSPKFWGKG